MAQSLSRTFSCPVELALEVLGGKWKPVILAHLKEGPKRYGELRARVPRLSDKMLTQRLHDLEELGLIERARTTYRLSARGESLRPVLESLHAWGRASHGESGATIEN